MTDVYAISCRQYATSCPFAAARLRTGARSVAKRRRSARGEKRPES